MTDNKTPFSLSIEEIGTLLAPLGAKVTGSCEEKAAIASLTADSRTVTEGGLFVAVNGAVRDGWEFLHTALEKRPALIVSEHQPTADEFAQIEAAGAVHIRISSSRLALAYLAAAFYGNPSEKLSLVAVTGTNGKTTTTTLLHRLFLSLGYKAGLIGTIENCNNTDATPAQLTTPDPIALNKLLYEMVQTGCKYVFMEASSHAIDQDRIAGLHLAGALFTNLTRDHIDYHKTMDAYIAAKKKLFDNLPKEAFALVNRDDRHAEVMLQNCAAKAYSYALHSPATFNARIIERSLSGTLIQIDGEEVWTRLVGDFNAYNLLSAYATASLLLNAGEDTEERRKLLIALSALDHARGRFEVLLSDHCTAIVDFAHTPDALEKVLDTIDDLLPDGGRVITVVGAGGNRDKGKRPMMARAAFDRSTVLILTSDNPRTEEPNAIIAEMKDGLTDLEQRNVICITDRREAIRTAVALAHPEDVVLVAGKGHETYQEVNGVRRHFDDAEELRMVLDK